MKIMPALDEVREIAASGAYRVLPVSCEILSDCCTPIEALRVLKNVSTHCYLLESVAEREKWGRYTFLGFDPKLEITCIDGTVRAGDIQLKTDDPSAFLRQIFAEYKSPVSITCPPSRAVSSDIFRMITSVTANPPYGPTCRTPRPSRTSISCSLTR